MLQNVARGKTYPLWVALALTFWAVLVGIPSIVQAEEPSGIVAVPTPPPLPFKLPPGSRKLPDDAGAAAGAAAPPGSPGAERYTLSSGLAEATRFLDRQLTRTGVALERIGPYRVRGIEVTRFISQTPSTPWLAIHLSRKEGRSFLDVVARLPSARTP